MEKKTVFISQNAAKNAVAAAWRAGRIATSDPVQIRRWTTKEADKSVSRGFIVFLPLTHTFL